MANKEEILAGLAEIVNEETGVEVEDVQLDKSSRPLATQSTSPQTQPKL